MSLTALQTSLDYTFQRVQLLEQALTHRSHSAQHNERLEFLGDSILNCVIASLLYDRFLRIDEGDLSRLRANLVKQSSLAEVAQRLELSRYLRLGEGELKSGGFRRPSILADTLEAIFGAVYLDSGFEAAHQVISRLYGPALETVDPKTLGKDAKTLLQEYLQGRKIALPVYTVVATHGAAHSQEFEVECVIAKLDIQVVGSGGSRRAAEQSAASKALAAAQASGTAPARKARARKQAQLSLPVATIQPVTSGALQEPAAASTTTVKVTKKTSSAKPAELLPDDSSLAVSVDVNKSDVKPDAKRNKISLKENGKHTELVVDDHTPDMFANQPDAAIEQSTQTQTLADTLTGTLDFDAPAPSGKTPSSSATAATKPARTASK